MRTSSIGLYDHLLPKGDVPPTQTTESNAAGHFGSCVPSFPALAASSSPLFQAAFIELSSSDEYVSVLNDMLMMSAPFIRA
jgi:hypothetical protein